MSEGRNQRLAEINIIMNLMAKKKYFLYFVHYILYCAKHGLLKIVQLLNMLEALTNPVGPGKMAPSAPTGIVVVSCVHLSVRPSVRFERHYCSNFLRNIATVSAWNLVGWWTVPWSRSLFKTAMLDQFLRVPLTELWNLPWYAWVRFEGRRCRFNSIRI